MELRHLRYFVTLAEEGTFARAAARLRVAQPSLSRQIRDLEREIGVDLLERAPQTSRLTPAGEAVLRGARAILRETAHAVHQARHSSRGLAGRCAVCAGTLPTWTGLVARLVAAVRRESPSIELDVTEGVGASQWRAVRSGAVDVGIGMVPAPEFDDLARSYLFDQSFDAALVSDRHSLARRASIQLADLETEPLIAIFGADSDHRSMCLQLASRMTARPVIRDAVTLADAFAQVAAGNGWTPFVESFAAWLPPGTTSIPVRDLDCSIALYAIWKPGNEPAVMRKVRATLMELAAAPQHDAPQAVESASPPDPSAERTVHVPLALELRHLRYFFAVVDAGSIGRAAERLSITQPALSRQMRELERLIGVALFNRTSKGTALTPAGGVLAERARAILELAASLPAEAHRATRGSMRQCVIATIPTPVVARLLATVSRTAAVDMPNVQVSVAELPTPEQPAALVAGQIDVGVCHAFTTVSPYLVHLHRERLVDDSACCALLAPEHRLAAAPSLALADLADVPFLFMPRSLYPAFYDRVMTFFAAHGFLPRVERPYDGLQTTWSLARRGEGWCIGFRTNLRYPPAGLAAVPVRELDLPLGIDLLHRRDETRGVVLALLDAIRRAALAEMATWADDGRPFGAGLPVGSVAREPSGVRDR